MNCLKLRGQGLMAKTFDRQVAEMRRSREREGALGILDQRRPLRRSIARRRLCLGRADGACQNDGDCQG